MAGRRLFCLFMFSVAFMAIVCSYIFWQLHTMSNDTIERRIHGDEPATIKPAEYVKVEIDAYKRLVLDYLSPWSSTGINEQDVLAALSASYSEQGAGWAAAGQTGQNVRFSVIGNRLYVDTQKSQLKNKRKQRYDHLVALFKRLLASACMGNVSFVVNLNDRPKIARSESCTLAGQVILFNANAGAELAPKLRPFLFSFATTSCHYDIPIPGPLFSPIGIWGIAPDAFRPPKERRPQAIWRGSCNDRFEFAPNHGITDLNMSRLSLTRAAWQCPELVDARLTSYASQCQVLDTKGWTDVRHPSYKLGKRVDLRVQANNSMAIHVDGNGWSSALEEKLISQFTVLKQSSPYFAFYYPLLQAGYHYIPLSRDLADVCSIAKTCARPEHTTSCSNISSNGYKFAATYLKRDSVDAYVLQLLQRVAQLQRYTPAPIGDLIWADSRVSC